MGFPNITFLVGTLGLGGSERNVYYSVRALKLAGSNVRVLSMTPGGHWHDEIERLGVSCRAVGSSRWIAPQLARIVRELHDGSTEIVHAGHFWVNPYALAVARLLGIREIGAINSQIEADIRKLPAWASRVVLGHVRLFSSKSRSAIAGAVRLGVPESRLAYFPGAVDTDEFSPPARRPDGPVILLAVGRLVKAKRYDRLIRVLARVRGESTTSFRTVIVGSGPERERLLALAEAAGLYPGLIEFLPATPDVAEHYRRAHVLVHTSDIEGTPTVQLEAMACALPIVATRSGDTAEVIREGEEGFLADCDHEEVFAERLRERIEKPSLHHRLGDNGLDRVRARFSAALLPERLAGLYQRRLEDQ